MTTITIERALLEQALNVLTGFEQNYGSLWYSSYGAEQIDATCSALRAALSAPATAPDELERLRAESEERL